MLSPEPLVNVVDYDPDYVKLANGNIVRIDRLEDSPPATGMTLETCMAVTSLTPQTARVYQEARKSRKKRNRWIVATSVSFVAMTFFSFLVSRFS